MPRIQHKRGTAANLASVNPTPLAGELVWDSTENAIKIGDGATAWSSLAYVTATPRTHKSTHATGGSDALSPSDIGAAPAASPTFTGGATFSTSALVEVSSATGRAAPVPTEIRIATTSAGSDWSTTDAWGRLGFYSADTSGNGPATQAAVDAVSTSTAGATSNLVFRLWNGVSLATRGTLTATGLDIPGVITVSATSGSAGSYAPSLTFSGDSNTGFGQVSGQSDTASIFTAGSERVRVDSSGRVGIGTTSPAGQLELERASNANFSGAFSFEGAALQISDNSDSTTYPTASAQLQFKVGSSGIAEAYIAGVRNSANASSLVFGTQSGASRSERVRIDASGNLLVGTTTASSLLTVNGVITVSATSGSAGSYLPSVTFSGDSNTGFGQVSGQSDTASVFTAGHERVRVDASGRVGIGRTPSVSGTSLECAGTIWSSATGHFLSNILADVGSASVPSFTFQGTGGTGIFRPAISNLGISTGGTERVRVKNTGAVRFVPLSADPASGEAGDVYYNSSTNKLRVYDGTNWIDLH